MKTLKWISVLPLSIVALFLSYVLLRIGNNFMVSRVLSPDSWSHYFLVTIVSNMLSTAIFVYVGAYIAPSYKKTTAVVLTVLFSIIAGGSLYATNFINKDYISNIGIIAAIVGAVVSCITILKSENIKELGKDLMG